MSEGCAEQSRNRPFADSKSLVRDSQNRRTYTAIAAGGRHTCALRADGTATCWGDDSAGRDGPPSGRFIAIDSGQHACGVRSDGTATCWEVSRYRYDSSAVGYADAPDGTFTAIAAAHGHACGLRGDGSIVCWGEGSLVVPAG